MQGPGTGGGLIAVACARSGLSQAELARRAALPRSVVNAYARGTRQPGVEALARIVEAAGLRLAVVPPPLVDPVRADRILTQVLDLAERLPARRRGPLRYPPLR